MFPPQTHSTFHRPAIRSTDENPEYSSSVLSSSSWCVVTGGVVTGGVVTGGVVTGGVVTGGVVTGGVVTGLSEDWNRTGVIFPTAAASGFPTDFQNYRLHRRSTKRHSIRLMS